MMQIIIEEEAEQVTYPRTFGKFIYRIGRVGGRLFLQVQKLEPNEDCIEPASTDIVWVPLQALLSRISGWRTDWEYTGTAIADLVPKNHNHRAFTIAVLRDIGALEEVGVATEDDLSGMPSRPRAGFSAAAWSALQLAETKVKREIPLENCKFFEPESVD